MIHEGDCVDVMAAMPAASVDAVVCDPPYGLGFMGKAWDAPGRDFTQRRAARENTFDHVGGNHNPTDSADRARTARVENQRAQEWHHGWAVEALRVLRPGGHLVAFGGTRTYHRLAAAIEDAGFEIRDCLMWLYGSGFPKSLDVGKAIDRVNGKPEPGDDFRAYLRSAIEAKAMTMRDVDRASGTNGMVGHWTGRSQPEYPTRAQWAKLKVLLALDDAFDHLIEWAEAEREVVGERVAPLRQPHFAGPTYGGDSASGPIPVTAPATPEAERWDGWGTALKPAWEPIVLARKPLAGTVAGNVLAHGTGALNIDATRIAHSEECRMLPDQHGDEAGNFYRQGGRHGETLELKPEGRWPANVLLAHDPDCVQLDAARVNGNGHHPAARGAGGLGTAGHAGQDELVERSGPEVVERWACVPGCPVRMLDDQAGYTRDGVSGRGRGFQRGAYVDGANPQNGLPPMSYGAGGYASRFFYCAKASRAERGAGLDDRNHHPTVKPVEVMRWLCRLVTPPGGIILDPFCGSGTTGIAAALEGFGFVGVERDAGYADLARRRVAYWTVHGAEALERVKAAERAERARVVVAQAGQLDLFGGA